MGVAGGVAAVGTRHGQHHRPRAQFPGRLRGLDIHQPLGRRYPGQGSRGVEQPARHGLAGRIYKAYLDLLSNPRWQRAPNCRQPAATRAVGQHWHQRPEGLRHSLHQSARLSVHNEHHARGNVEGVCQSWRPRLDHGAGRWQLRRGAGSVCQGRHQCECTGRATSGRGRRSFVKSWNDLMAVIAAKSNALKQTT